MSLKGKIIGTLIEEVPRDGEGSYDVPDEETSVEASIPDSVDTSNVISDIYYLSGEENMDGIYKLEELLGNLPSEMTTDAKRSTIRGILKSFDITTDYVSGDGERKLCVLKDAREKLNANSDAHIEALESEIEDLKIKISSLSGDIETEQKKKKESNDAIDEEVQKLEKLVEFIGEEN